MCIGHVIKTRPSASMPKQVVLIIDHHRTLRLYPIPSSPPLIPSPHPWPSLRCWPPSPRRHFPFQRRLFVRHSYVRPPLKRGLTPFQVCGCLLHPTSTASHFFRCCHNPLFSPAMAGPTPPLNLDIEKFLVSVSDHDLQRFVSAVSLYN